MRCWGVLLEDGLTRDSWSSNILSRSNRRWARSNGDKAKIRRRNQIITSICSRDCAKLKKSTRNRALTKSSKFLEVQILIFGGSEFQKFQVRSNSTKSLSNVPHILHSLVAQLTAHAPPPPPILSPQSQFYS